MYVIICVMQQPNSPWALLERSRFKTWLGQCLVLGFSSLWSINEYPLIVKQAWWNAKGNLAMDQHSIQWGVVHLILLVTSCLGNWNKLLLDRLFGSVTDFPFTTLETVDLLPYMASFSLLTGISSLFVLTLNGFKWRLWQLRKYFRNFLWLGIIP